MGKACHICGRYLRCDPYGAYLPCKFCYSHGPVAHLCPKCGQNPCICFRPCFKCGKYPCVCVCAPSCEPCDTPLNDNEKGSTTGCLVARDPYKVTKTQDDVSEGRDVNKWANCVGVEVNAIVARKTIKDTDNNTVNTFDYPTIDFDGDLRTKDTKLKKALLVDPLSTSCQEEQKYKDEDDNITHLSVSNLNQNALYVKNPKKSEQDENGLTCETKIPLCVNLVDGFEQLDTTDPLYTSETRRIPTEETVETLAKEVTLGVIKECVVEGITTTTESKRSVNAITVSGNTNPGGDSSTPGVDKKLKIDEDGRLQIDVIDTDINQALSNGVDEGPTDKSLSITGNTGSVEKKIVVDDAGHLQIDVLETQINNALSNGVDEVTNESISISGHYKDTNKEKKIGVDEHGNLKLHQGFVGIVGSKPGDVNNSLVETTETVSVSGRVISASDSNNCTKLRELGVDNEGHLQIDVLETQINEALSLGNNTTETDRSISITGHTGSGEQKVKVDDDGHLQVDVLETEINSVILENGNTLSTSKGIMIGGRFPGGTAPSDGFRTIQVDQDGKLQVDIVNENIISNPRGSNNTSNSVSISGNTNPSVSGSGSDRKIKVDNDGFLQVKLVDALQQVSEVIPGTNPDDLGAAVGGTSTANDVGVEVIGVTKELLSGSVTGGNFNNGEFQPINITSQGAVYASLTAKTVNNAGNEDQEKSLICDSEGRLHVDVLGVATESTLSNAESHLGNIETSVDVIEACVESDKVNVNISSDSAGLATQSTLADAEAHLGNIDSAVKIGDGTVSPTNCVVMGGKIDDTTNNCNVGYLSITSDGELKTSNKTLNDCVGSNKVNVNISSDGAGLATESTLSAAEAHLGSIDTGINHLEEAVKIGNGTVSPTNCFVMGGKVDDTTDDCTVKHLTITSVGELKTSNKTLNDCVGSNKVNVNISSQDVDIATESTLSAAEVHLGHIDTGIDELEACVGQDGQGGPTKCLSVAGTEVGGNIRELSVDSSGHLQVDVLTSDLPTDASTSALQTTINQTLVTIDGVLDNIKLDTDAVKTSVELIDDVVGEDSQDGPTKCLSVAGTASDGKIRELSVDSSGHLQVDVLTSDLPTDASTSALQTTINETLVTIDGVLDDIKLDTAGLATESTLTAAEAHLGSIDTGINNLEEAVKIGNGTVPPTNCFVMGGKVDDTTNDCTVKHLTITSDGELKTSNKTLNDCVGSNKVNVNISSQDVDIATQTTLADAEEHLGNIDTGIDELEACVGQDGQGGPSKCLSVAGTDSGGNIRELSVDSSGHLQVDVLTSDLPTDASTSALQTTINQTLVTIDGVLDNIKLDTDAVKTSVELIDDVVGEDGQDGPTKCLSVAGTDPDGKIQELSVDSDGKLQTVDTELKECIGIDGDGITNHLSVAGEDSNGNLKPLLLDSDGNLNVKEIGNTWADLDTQTFSLNSGEIYTVGQANLIEVPYSSVKINGPGFGGGHRLVITCLVDDVNDTPVGTPGNYELSANESIDNCCYVETSPNINTSSTRRLLTSFETTGRYFKIRLKNNDSVSHEYEVKISKGS